MNHTYPLILRSQDLTLADTRCYRIECDCACADNSLHLQIEPGITQQPIQCSANLHSQSLPGPTTLMFNPLRAAGMAVLNNPARAIWETFRLPQPVDRSKGDAFVATVERLLAAGLLEPLNASIQPHHTAPRVLSAWLHLTSQCNLRCDYCYVPPSSDTMDECTGRAAIDAVIRSALKHGFTSLKLKYSGGEATLHLPLVFALDDYARAQAAVAGLALETVMLSNGVTIGEHAIKALVSRGIRVMISLDGLAPAHDAQRKFPDGQGSFACVDRTLDRLIAHGMQPFISITLTNRNADGLPGVVEYVLDRDLPFNINFYRESEYAPARPAQHDLKLSNQRIINALLQAFAVIECNLPTRSLLPSLIDRAQFDQPHSKVCGAGESYLVIDPHGNIAKCHMEIGKAVTDVRAEDPLGLVRASQRGIHNLSAEQKEDCRECEWRYWCAGGCPLMTYHVTGRYDLKSPNCDIYKAIYPGLLRLEGLRLLNLAR